MEDYKVKTSKEQLSILKVAIMDYEDIVYKQDIYTVLSKYCFNGYARLKRDFKYGDIEGNWINAIEGTIAATVKELETTVMEKKIKKAINNEIQEIYDRINGAIENEEEEVQFYLTIKQMEFLWHVCDTMCRVICGQSSTIASILMEAWSNLHQYDTEEYCNVRSRINVHCNILHKLCFNFADNCYNGIGYDDDSDCLFDMCQVFRHVVWETKPEDKRTQYTTDAFPAHMTSKKYNLITVNKN